MYEKILESLLSRYGHLTYPELTSELRKNGLGEFVDLIENNPDIMDMISEASSELFNELPDDIATGIMPSGQPISGDIVDLDGTIKFNQKACLESCAGDCCKSKNYLMININDIYNIISSPMAGFLDIHSTRDLFERKPPLLEIFFHEEYDFYLPYIRYLPVNADLIIYQQ